jgi:hypothetical protein
MNRRTLLTMLPVAPLALVTGASVVAAEAVTAVTVDTRPAFKLVDYVMWEIDPRKRQACEHCTVVHQFYTHGCQPVAMPVAWQGPGRPVPAEVTAVPQPAYDGCDFQTWMAGQAPHQHHDFRWVD